jgi:hypothetical protein
MLSCALALSAAAGAATPDRATIVNSGSTNTMGYTIEVRSDGTGSVTIQRGSAKTFHLANGVDVKFFADLAAARATLTPAGGCIKSASFGTSTRIAWQGWTSPDLECPAPNAKLSALIDDLHLIRQAAGIGAPPLRSRVEPGPSASP